MADWRDDQNAENENEPPTPPMVKVPILYSWWEFQRWLGLTQSQLDEEPDDWVWGQYKVWELKAEFGLL